MILGNILSKAWVRLSGPPPMRPPLSLHLVPPQSLTSAPVACLTTSAAAPWHNCLLTLFFDILCQHQYGPSAHIDTNCFPWNYQNAYTLSPPSFVPGSNLNLNAKPQPQPKPKTIPTQQPVQHPHQAPPQPVAQPLGVADTNIDNNPFPAGVGC